MSWNSDHTEMNYTYGIPGNCGVLLVYDLPHGSCTPLLADEVINNLEYAIERAKRHSMSMVMVTTVHNQAGSEEILESLGFDKSQTMVRYPNGPERNTTIWWKPVRNYE